MNKIKTSLAMVGAALVLTACGGSDHPHPPPGAIVAPPASPAIHFKVNDGQGNTLDLMIECGDKTKIQECADVNKSIIEQVTKIRSNTHKD